MKTKLKLLLLLPLFALFVFTSCQNEVIDVTEPNESEALVAESELTELVAAAAKMDGSKDNIIDRASCLSVHLPVTVKVKGLSITIDSEEDFNIIESIFKEFDDDVDRLDFIFPITIILSDYEEVIIDSPEALAGLVNGCGGESEPDDDIECIDFQYPISFSVYDRDFQVIDVVTVDNDRQLYGFIDRIRKNEVLARINFPITMELADGTEEVVNNNAELKRIIEAAKDACDEDDDNDYGDDDFTPEQLNTYLMSCPWVVHEFMKNELDLTPEYREFGLKFMPEDVVLMRTLGGGTLTGFWHTRLTEKGALLEISFPGMTDFNFEMVVYDISEGVIKLYKEGGNRIIMKRNCEVVIGDTKERIESFLKECLWRVERISVDGISHERDYIGTPLKFFPENVVKLIVNGEYIEGTYEVFPKGEGFVLHIMIAGRPHLQLEWYVKVLEPGLIELESGINRMILERHCPSVDPDLNYVDDILISSQWEVASYEVGGVNMSEEFFMYTLNFIETGKVIVTDPNSDVFLGSWLSYRKEGLNLGLFFGNTAPFDDLNHRWKIVEKTPSQIILHQYNFSGETVKELVLNKKI